MHHPQADEADGNVDKKDDAPVEIVDDEAAGDGSEHGADESGDGDRGHGSDELGFGEGADDGEAADGHHHGASAALEDAEGYEDVDVGGDAAEKRAEAEQADGGGEDAAGAEAIGHPAADGDEDGEAQGVAGEHGLHAERGDFEGLRDGGHGGVENGGVERLHEEGDGHQPGEQSFAGVTRAHGVIESGVSDAPHMQRHNSERQILPLHHRIPGRPHHRRQLLRLRKLPHRFRQIRIRFRSP